MKQGDDNVDRLQRLIHQETFASPEEARLRDLVQGSRPGDLSEETRQAVYGSVLERQQARGHGRAAMLRPAVAFTVLLVAAGATAAATLGQRWIAHGNSPTPAPPALAAPQPHDRPVAPAEASGASAAVAIPVPEPQSQRRQPNRVRARSEDPSEVVMAVEALRNQRDPGRAAKLLAQYLAAHPRGALVEEAVALSIEAAAARRDPSAAEFAKRYLRDYPNGRFRQAAETALARQP